MLRPAHAVAAKSDLHSRFAAVLLDLRHRSEQYLTSAQLAAHFRRHVNSSPQHAQIFVGRFSFFTIFGMAFS